MKRRYLPSSSCLVAPNQRGLTLVELMVAMAISLILVAGIATLIAQQSSTRAELDNSNRQMENGRYAASLLRDDIQHAGFYGHYSGGFTALTALPDPCNVGTGLTPTALAGIDASLAFAVQGYSSPAAGLSPCLEDANHINGTDILVVRRLETVDNLSTLSTAVAGQIYVQTTADAKVTAAGPDPTPAAPTVYTLKQKDAVTPAEIRKYVQHIYFLSPCNVFAAGSSTCDASADGGQPIPTLKRLEMTVASGLPSLITVPLVEGIENMQFDYGVDSTGDGTPNTPFIQAPAVADWPNVMVVQVNLLARTLKASAGYTDTKTYNLGLTNVGPLGGGYRRHVYTVVARAVNQSGRKE